MRARTFVFAAALLLAACHMPPAQGAADAAVAASTAMSESLAQAQAATAAAALPALLSVQDAADVVAEPLPPPTPSHGLDPAAVALIVQDEIISPAVYTKRYQAPSCPGGASGPTIGIGYDLGQQTSARIAATWAAHPDVARLKTASGQVGEAKCAAWRERNRDIRVPISLAQQVFTDDVLPDYARQAERALHRGWPAMSRRLQGVSVSLGYNRGWRMVGTRNAEKREIRDRCAPSNSGSCFAGQERAMKRLWPTDKPPDPHLRQRREAEARLAEGAS